MNSSKRIAISLLFVALFAVGVHAQEAVPSRTPDVVFVPTPHEVVAEMLRLAEVDKNDIVYDLGCGDGRLVITAAQKFGARGVGIDIDPQRIKESKENAAKAGVNGRVKFLQADLFTSDISEATAVTLYLLNTLNEKLRPKLLAELKPGTPIVSHDFSMGDWEPEQTIQVKGPTRTHTVYRWTIPAKASGVWQWKQGEDEYQLAISQNYSAVHAALNKNGQLVTVREAKLRGDRLFVTYGSDDSAGKFDAVITGSEMTIRSMQGEEVARAHRTEGVVASSK
jgi:SAM-dependent methyltransferase